MKRVVAIILSALLFTFVIPDAVLADEVRPQESEARLPQDPQQGRRAFRLFGYGMCVATAADAASTEWGLRRPEIFEVNPLMANRGVRLASHVLAPAAMWWATERLRKTGHRKSALLLRIGMTTGFSYLTIRNIRTATRH